MLKMKTINIIILILVLFIDTINAQIMVAPSHIEVYGEKGALREGYFTVFNNGDKEAGITINLRKWKYTKGNDDLKVSDWLKVEPIDFIIPPHSKKFVKYSVTIPENLYGEMSAMVGFRLKGKGSIVQQISIALYVRCIETSIIKGEIESVSFVTNYPLMYNKSESRFYILKIKLKNLGNVHLRPKGDVVIKDREGNIVSNLKIRYGGVVFPGKEKFYYTSKLNQNLKDGLYTAVATMKYLDVPIKSKCIKFKVNNNKIYQVVEEKFSK